MNIALIGYGKMGHSIERIALERGHNIVCIIDIDNAADFDSEAFRSAHVAIEFTTPNTAVANIHRCWQHGIPVVCGTTGWNELLPQLRSEADTKGCGLLWTSNFSVGVNAVMDINRRLADILHSNDEYRITITEIHHIHKKDKPSGTAITLAQDIVERVNQINSWKLNDGNECANHQLPITSIRQGEEPGTHTITYDGPYDTITITHSAKSRDGFALGAVIAAEFMQGKKGFHDFREILK